MTNVSHYIYESILDDIGVQDSARATDTLLNDANKEELPDPYVDDNYDFELEISTPNIQLRSRDKIVTRIRKWMENLDTVMTSLRQITRCTRSIFYSRYESRLKDIVQDEELIREPKYKNLYGTGLFVRFDHNFKTVAQIMKFVCQLVLCVTTI